MPAFKVLPAGDTALVVELGETIDRQLSRQVLALARRINEARWEGVIETVPTFRSLMVHYDPLLLPAASLAARIGELMQGLSRPGAAGICRPATTRTSRPTWTMSRRAAVSPGRKWSSATAPSPTTSTCSASCRARPIWATCRRS